MSGRDFRDDFCAVCGRPVTRDEAAVTRKLISRGTETFFCTDCLAARFRVDPQVIRGKIRQFREMGCTLFDKEP